MYYPHDYNFAKIYQQILLKTANSDVSYGKDHTSRKTSILAKLGKMFSLLFEGSISNLLMKEESNGLFHTGELGRSNH